MLRDQTLLTLRPFIEVDLHHSLPEEQFQNNTLRPVIKLQNDLLLAVFNNYLEEKSIKIHAMSPFKQRLTIENSVKKDLPLRHTLIGCIIGHFTAEEYATYFTNRVALHKRITTLLIQRFSDTIIKVETSSQ